MESTTREAIDQFLSCHRIAAVGVSRDAKHFSRLLYRDLRARGYDVVAVNPAAAEIEGERCYANVASIVPPVEAALLFTTGPATEAVVRDCVEAGIKRIWMYKAVGAGAVTPAAVEYCRANDVALVPGECPYMFLPDTAWFHRLHGFARRLTGSYPA